MNRVGAGVIGKVVLGVVLHDVVEEAAAAGATREEALEEVGVLSLTLF